MLIEKLTSEKGTRITLLICCILVTVAIIFHVVASSIQRGNIELAISRLEIDFELSRIESQLSRIVSQLSDIERRFRY